MNDRPMMFIDLKNKWSKEKAFYRTHELGSGVHSFVVDILTNPELLNLREGKLSTFLTDRKNEFIHEKNAKEKRRADFYIYINPEIAIPIEVECYENIQAGEKQKEIKDLIDDLVFCLYFNIGVPKDKVSNADFIKSLCLKNKFYIQIKDI